MASKLWNSSTKARPCNALSQETRRVPVTLPKISILETTKDDDGKRRVTTEPSSAVTALRRARGAKVSEVYLIASPYGHPLLFRW